MGHLNAEEGGEDDVAEDDEVDLVEEAAEHQDHEDQVHDGKDAHRHSLCKAVQGQVGWHTTDPEPTYNVRLKKYFLLFYQCHLFHYL